MEITNKEYREWKSVKEHGDFVKIAKQSGFHVVYVQNSFKQKRCSPAVYAAFKLFFEARKEEIKKLRAA